MTNAVLWDIVEPNYSGNEAELHVFPGTIEEHISQMRKIYPSTALIPIAYKETGFGNPMHYVDQASLAAPVGYSIIKSISKEGGVVRFLKAQFAKEMLDIGTYTFFSES